VLRWALGEREIERERKQIVWEARHLIYGPLIFRTILASVEDTLVYLGQNCTTPSSQV
jgi:hypothetical protein